MRDERGELEREKKRKKFKNDKKRKQPEHEAAAVTPASTPQEAVVGLLKTMRAPVHIAALSVAYKQKTGRTMKQDHKKGGMLNFLKTVLKDEVLVAGTGNDSFVRLATPNARATHWLRECMRDNGPILVSMVGRLYNEAHGRHFGDDFPQSSLTAFMQGQLGKELVFEAQKGNEQLVDLKARGTGRYFLPESSKKQRADGAAAAEAPRLDPASLLSRGGAAAYPSSSRVLVVGEADFTWCEALLAAWRAGAGAGAAKKAVAAKLTATSYDSAAELDAKYDGVAKRTQALRAAGATVAHGVDAMQLGGGGGGGGGAGGGGGGSGGGGKDAATAAVEGPFDVVAFHFPHVGTDAGLAASLAANKALLEGFLRAVPAVLAPGGEVHVTLVHRYPYTAWRQAWAAGVPGLEPIGDADFEFGAYAGYRHQATTATAGLRGDLTAAALEVHTRCITYAWRRAEAPEAQAPSPAAAAPAKAEAKAPKAPKAAKAAKVPKAKAEPKAVVMEEVEDDDDEGDDEAAAGSAMLAEANAALELLKGQHAAAPPAKKLGQKRSRDELGGTPKKKSPKKMVGKK